MQRFGCGMMRFDGQDAKDNLKRVSILYRAKSLAPFKKCFQDHFVFIEEARARRREQLMAAPILSQHSAQLPHEIVNYIIKFI
jgi:hypothetical protein